MLLVDKEPLVRKKLLAGIGSPQDLRELALADLEDLAEELRESIIERLPKPAAIWRRVWGWSN